MATVRNKDSKAELALRRALHARGLRYRLHPKDVPGHPDLSIKTRRLAVFVDGDLWHGNPQEPRRRGWETFDDLFPTRTDWWVTKINRNMERDQRITTQLTEAGWTVVRLWESVVLADPTVAAERVFAALAER